MAILWIGFLLLVALFLALDLGVFHRQQHVVGFREAMAWTAVWIACSLAFNVFIYVAYDNHWLGLGTLPFQATNGREAALSYLTAYVLEKSLSLDNIFVFAVIFGSFGVHPLYQHRVLFWGIIGAVVLRGIMITAGVAALQHLEWLTYVFGMFLLFTGWKMLRHDMEEESHPEKSWVVRAARRVLPMHNEYREGHFTVVFGGKRLFTPLAIVLIVVESSDVMFAVDSVPAVLAVTKDTFIAFTSNIFAILGLRAMYFALAGVLRKFRYLHQSLAILLGYIGVKMLLQHHWHIPTALSLGVIALILQLPEFHIH